MRKSLSVLAAVVGVAGLLSQTGFASNHREAPITALDHKADITDFFAFVSYDDPGTVTFFALVDHLPRIGERIITEDNRRCKVTNVYHKTAPIQEDGRVLAHVLLPSVCAVLLDKDEVD